MNYIWSLSRLWVLLLTIRSGEVRCWLCKPQQKLFMLRPLFFSRDMFDQLPDVIPFSLSTPHFLDLYFHSVCSEVWNALLPVPALNRCILLPKITPLPLSPHSHHHTTRSYIASYMLESQTVTAVSDFDVSFLFTLLYVETTESEEMVVLSG